MSTNLLLSVQGTIEKLDKYIHILESRPALDSTLRRHLEDARMAADHLTNIQLDLDALADTARHLVANEDTATSLYKVAEKHHKLATKALLNEDEDAFDFHYEVGKEAQRELNELTAEGKSND